MNPLFKLIEHGQSYWMDDLTRSMIRSGELARRVREEGLRGITSNPKIFHDAISKGDDYDEQIRHLMDEGHSVEGIYEALTVTDVRETCDVLAPVYEDSRGLDGFVSLEVSPYLAHDTEGSIAEAHRLWQAVGRPNLLIKIPGTPAGVPAIEACLFDGININITLLFSIASYEAVANAYIRALERRAAAGKPVAEIASVASFFLSRIDVLVDRLLGHRIRPARPRDQEWVPEDLIGKTAVANAKLAYQRFKDIFAGPSWQALERKGARVQRVLWASTSTKDPLYDDVCYVEPLIGPHTVNTMPGRTIAAFAERGTVKTTVEEGMEEARRVMEDLGRFGIDLDCVTSQLIDEGVQKFIAPYDDVMKTLAQKCQRFLADKATRERFSLGPASSAVESVLGSLQARRFGARLFARDPGLWSSDPKKTKAIINRLGWLDTQKFREKSREIREFAEDTRRNFGHVVLLGMGGSSLCAEVCHRVFGSAEGWPAFLMLDSTDPAAVRQIESRTEPVKTLFLVASKSGTTLETLSFYRYFRHRLEQAGAKRWGDHFVAITDPGTPLAREAREAGFLRIFENSEDIGGRYSALSYFGLVPMALLGMDIDSILERANQMNMRVGSVVPTAVNPGISLGAALAMAARSGWDKVTFVCSESLAPFGAWVEQLLAESTGKAGRGLVPVIDELIGAPHVYGNDRLFVHLRLKSDPDEERARRLDALKEAGHPVLQIELMSPIGLGGEFIRWEIATATAGAILGVNPFDEPNVAESKRNTDELLKQWEREGRVGHKDPLMRDQDIELYAPADTPKWIGHSMHESFQRYLQGARAGDYIALLAFLPPVSKINQELAELRLQLRDRLKVPVTVGYGPRYLHSTGQLHKGGPESGLFALFTADSAEDASIPDKPYGFGTLERMQALGDLRSLADKGRRVVRLHLGIHPELALGRLVEGLKF
jgi:transaldolase, mycobacterial type